MYVSKIPQSFFRQPLRQQGTAGHSRAQRGTSGHSRAQRGHRWAQQGTEGQCLAWGCSAKSLFSLGFSTFSVKVDLAEGGCE